MQFPGAEPTRPISPKLSDTADRRAWMDKNGIDHQLVGGGLDSFGYELPAGGGPARGRHYKHCPRGGPGDGPRLTPPPPPPPPAGGAPPRELARAPGSGFGGGM